MRTFCLAAAFSLGVAQAALAQPFTPDRIDAEAARREGTVSWYTSTPVELAQELAIRFEQHTGIKVQLLRSGGSALLRRLLQEVQAGRPGADVLTMSDAGGANGLVKQGVFAPFKPEGFDQVLDHVKDAQGHWIAQRLQLVAMLVRSDKVADTDAPKTWSDLQDGKYKGRMVMPDPSFTTIQLVVVGMLSRQLGWDFYKALRANETMIVQGHQQVYATLQQGERVIGAEGTDPRAYTQGQDAANMKMIFPTEGVIFVPSPTAVIRGAAHPNAARLLAQFMLTREVQLMMVAAGFHASRRDLPPPKGMPGLTEIKSIPVDYAYIEDHGRELKAKFGEIFQ